MSALIPYAGKIRADHTGRPRPPTPPAPLSLCLSFMGEEAALRLFRSGKDTVEIAGILQCTKSAAANGLANARERAQARVEREGLR